MKAHIFLIANPKFQLQILCSFGDISKRVKLNGIPENNFLCIFIIASSPGVHTFFCLWRVNKKLPQGENSQNAFSEVKVNQLKVKNMHVRIGISTFNVGIATFFFESNKESLFPIFFKFLNLFTKMKLTLKGLRFFSLPFVHNGGPSGPPPKKHFSVAISARTLHHTCIHPRQLKIRKKSKTFTNGGQYTNFHFAKMVT